MGRNNSTSTVISDCYSNAVTASERTVGGIAGINYGTIKNCGFGGETGSAYNIYELGCDKNGNKNEDYRYLYSAGGICGIDYDKISNCFNNSPRMAVTKYYGGIVGILQKSGNVSYCVNSSDVLYDDVLNGGLIAGYASNKFTVKNCYTKGVYIMKCKNCGRKGLFFKVNSDGLCPDCVALMKIEENKHQLQSEIEQHQKELNEIQDAQTNERAELKRLEDERQVIYNTIKRQAECAAIATVREQIDELQGIKAEKETAVALITSDLEKLTKDFDSLTKKFVKMKTLYESYQSANKRYIKNNEQN